MLIVSSGKVKASLLFHIKLLSFQHQKKNQPNYSSLSTEFTPLTIIIHFQNHNSCFLLQLFVAAPISLVAERITLPQESSQPEQEGERLRNLWLHWSQPYLFTMACKRYYDFSEFIA